MNKVLAPWMIVLSAIIAPQLFAEELQVSIVDDRLNLVVKEILYPEKELLLELKNGLPNELEFFLTLSQSQNVFYQHSVRYKITYDLWDEHFIVHNSHKGTQQTVKTDQALFNFLSRISISDLYNLPEAKKNSPFNISYRLFFNPVKSEKIKKIQQWMRTSKGYSSTSDSTVKPPSVYTRANQGITSGGQNPSFGGSLNSSGPRFQKLFDKILEEYMSDDAIAAQWKSKSKSHVIDLKELAQ